MPDDVAVSPSLARLGNPARGYVHRDKILTPGEELALSASRLKWYDLSAAEIPVPDGIRELARGFLEREERSGRLSITGNLGFVILHRCSDQFYFLIVATWRNENEVWETVYAKADALQTNFTLFPLPGPHRGTFCVWELGAVWHERQAWRRFLLSPRDNAAKRAYLADCAAGAV
jgi:hypothetical protein